MVFRLLGSLLSAAAAGGLTYVGCYFWPLKLAQPTALVASISVALATILVVAVYLDGKSKDGE